DKTEAIANGTDRITYEATVTDQQGNAVNGAKVKWSADTADATLSSTQTISDSNGKSTITLTSLKAGEKVITAQT
ncbi:Ig-like domain-containing protein, partial [Enterobacter sp. PGRG2]|uniref:Ig-like domain-containing protein n=1 Tax=Enterobacter sp. PGRG2 TaxID=3104013 RepID=UPI002ABDC052